ncbi:MAG: spermidine synthase [Mycobacteriales bacterium]
MSRRRRGPATVTERVRTGLAELVADPDRPSAWLLMVDGTAQSHVDLSDPTHLEFEYVRRLGHLVDALAPPGQPLRALHLGGGGLTLPRYVAATRPRSRQRVIEIDPDLVALVRRELPLPTGSGIRIHTGDARDGLARIADGALDLVIADVFDGARVPAHLTSVEFAAAVARTLAPGGVYAANVVDGPPLAFARSQVASVRAAFAEVCLVAEPSTLRGRRYGNVLLLAADGPLPTAALARRLAGDPFPARLVEGADLTRFTAGAAQVPDRTARPSPRPPTPLLGS